MFNASGASRFMGPRRGIIVWSGGLSGSYGAEIGTPAAFDNFITPAHRAELRSKGFDTIRMPAELGTMAAASGATRTTHISRYVTNMNQLATEGWNVLMCLAPNGVSGYTSDSIVDGVSGTQWTEVREVWTEMAAMIATLRNPARIAIEPINEPGNAPTVDWTPMLAALHADIRSVDELSTIYVCPGFGNRGDVMEQFDGTLFTDPRIGMAFHFYPEPYTQQGVGDIGYHRSYQRIEIPVNVSAHAAQQANLESIMTSLGVDDTTKGYLRGDFNPYWTTPRDASWVAAQLASHNSWRAGVGLPVGMMICSEWSVTGDGTYLGADRTSRLNGLAMHRAAFETAGIPWVNNVLFGENQGFGQGILSDDFGFVFDDEVVGALIP